MLRYTFGGKNGQVHELEESPDHIVVRTRNASSLADSIHSGDSKEILQQFKTEISFPDADVTVLRTKRKSKTGIALRDQARKALKQEEGLRFAGRVLIDSVTKKPVLYTENLFIKFDDRISTDKCLEVFSREGLQVKQAVTYASNAWFVSAPEGTGQDVFELCNRLLTLPGVELCHPELIREQARKTIHSKQWHLKSCTIGGQMINAHIHAALAHQITRGEGITIAIVDDGVDIDHPEFKVPGKLVQGRDVTMGNNNPRPKQRGEHHGTACAGVAAASGILASGVAPAAKLMPVRFSSGLGSQQEAYAFVWAADHGADVISCSWGPEDGTWYDPTDARHKAASPLPDSTRLAIDYAVTKGRKGRGCLVFFAAGNGNEDIRYDGYNSYENVISVAACNDRGTRSVCIVIMALMSGVAFPVMILQTTIIPGTAPRSRKVFIQPTAGMAQGIAARDTPQHLAAHRAHAPGPLVLPAWCLL
jgi:hypothetical protein